MRRTGTAPASGTRRRLATASATLAAKLRITEIFLSLQGETSRAGLPTAFVRLTGCPLRRVWCDTAYAFSGGYEVAVRVGPSFESKRQEMVNAVVELSSRNPKILDVAGDLIFQNLDFPHADKIAERLAIMLLPELGGPQKPQQPPEAVLAAQAMAQGQVQAADTKARADLSKAQFETTTINETDRFRILVDAAVKLMIAEENNETKQAALALDAQDMQVKHLEGCRGPHR